MLECCQNISLVRKTLLRRDIFIEGSSVWRKWQDNKKKEMTEGNEEGRKYYGEEK